MSKRKKIPAEIEKQLLLKSRRRCCLCFWLEGIDEVVKGQLAHLDQDSSNSTFANLCFLCFKHHDEYDSRPNVSKGLQQSEVTQWRDELYKEMEFRFRTVKERKLELTIDKLMPVNVGKDFKIGFRLKNSGTAPASNLVVNIELEQNVTANAPKVERVDNGDIFGMVQMQPIDDDALWGFSESREDFFQSRGRVATIHPLRLQKRDLLPEHSVEFEGLGYLSSNHPDGSDLTIRYRLDAADMEPQLGEITRKIPKDIEWILEQPERFGFPSDVTLEEVKEYIAEHETDGL